MVHRTGETFTSILIYILASPLFCSVFSVSQNAFCETPFLTLLPHPCVPVLTPLIRRSHTKPGRDNDDSFVASPSLSLSTFLQNERRQQLSSGLIPQVFDIRVEEQVWFPAYGYRCRFVFCGNYCPCQDGWQTGSAHPFCKVDLVESQSLLAWKAVLHVQANLLQNKWQHNFFMCYGQLVRIHSKYYHRSGERRCVVFK